MERTTSEKKTYLCTAIYIAWIKGEGVCVSRLPLFVLCAYIPFCKVDTSKITNDTDWDDVTFGIYRTAATNGSAHTPPSTATKGYLLCFNREIYGVQVYIENGNTAYWYFRSIWKQTDGWSAWQKIPSLAGLLASSTDLASLASALKPYLDAL